jgi:hypothetical protein
MFQVSKKIAKNLDVARYVSYNCVKFYFKIPYTLGCTKNNKTADLV